jgi:hypothetical protein
MSNEENVELKSQVIGCLIEAFADEEGKIDQKGFNKIFNACVKAFLIAKKVPDEAVALVKLILVQVIPHVTVLHKNPFPALKQSSRQTGRLQISS